MPYLKTHMIMTQSHTGLLRWESLCTLAMLASVLACAGGDVYSGLSNLFYSDGYEVGRGLGVRPVVSLKSRVTVEQLEKTTGTADASWPEHGNVSIDSMGPS